MFWADKIAKELAKQKKPQLVNDAKTPSGRVHVGSLRGVIIHDLVFRALSENGVKTTYTYIFDDLDPMDSLPVYLPKEKYQQFMGFPLRKIPPPQDDPRFNTAKSAKSFAEFYALEFESVMNKLGVFPKILWSSHLYETGKLDRYIKLALDNAEKIQGIYEKISGSKRPKDYFPFQPICESCGKIGTAISTGWDGKEVTYECSVNRVAWAEGCGFKGKVSPFGGTGKMPFRVEWPAKWAALGVTVEGEGKDHASRGGTRDTANAISREIFDYDPPFDIPYEHFLLSGQKMSSSKGIGVSAIEVSEILPPEVLRFLMVRFRPMQHIDFNPELEHTIPKLFDDFDAARVAKDQDLKRIYELSVLREESNYFVPRFSILLNLVQMPNVNLEEQAERLKGAPLTSVDREKLSERVEYVKIYLERFAPEEVKFDVKEEMPEQAKVLSPKQKKLLLEIVALLKNNLPAEEFQNEIYKKGRELGLSSSQTFQSIYRSLIGKDSGPKAAWLILSLDQKFVEKRFKEVAKTP